MDSPGGLELGRTDAQVDVAKVGTVFGPSLDSGNGRMRHAVAPNLILEGEAGILHVTNEGAGPNRNAYTGRVGAIWQSDDQRYALTTGIGAGTSIAAGTWGGIDIGGMISGKHRYVRPVFFGDLGYSTPLGERRTFTVEDNVLLRLPRNYIIKGGVALELGREDFTIILGLTFVKFLLVESSIVSANSDSDDSSDEYVAAGVGLRFKL